MEIIGALAVGFVISEIIIGVVGTLVGFFLETRDKMEEKRNPRATPKGYIEDLHPTSIND